MRGPLESAVELTKRAKNSRPLLLLVDLAGLPAEHAKIHVLACRLEKDLASRWTVMQTRILGRLPSASASLRGELERALERAERAAALVEVARAQAATLEKQLNDVALGLSDHSRASQDTQRILHDSGPALLAALRLMGPHQRDELQRALLQANGMVDESVGEIFRALQTDWKALEESLAAFGQLHQTRQECVRAEMRPAVRQLQEMNAGFGDRFRARRANADRFERQGRVAEAMLAWTLVRDLIAQAEVRLETVRERLRVATRRLGDALQASNRGRESRQGPGDRMLADLHLCLGAPNHKQSIAELTELATRAEMESLRLGLETVSRAAWLSTCDTHAFGIRSLKARREAIGEAMPRLKHKKLSPRRIKGRWSTAGDGIAELRAAILEELPAPRSALAEETQRILNGIPAQAQHLFVRAEYDGPFTVTRSMTLDWQGSILFVEKGPVLIVKSGTLVVRNVTLEQRAGSEPVELYPGAEFREE